MKLIIQQGRDVFEVDIPEDAKVDQLHDEVEKQRGILKRRQKLIFKGKILPPHHTLGQTKASPSDMSITLVNSVCMTSKLQERKWL